MQRQQLKSENGVSSPVTSSLCKTFLQGLRCLNILKRVCNRLEAITRLVNSGLGRHFHSDPLKMSVENLNFLIEIYRLLP